MKTSLETLLQRPDIWRAKAGVAAVQPTLSTGLPALDHALGGGWPVGALVELLLEQAGIGELRLLLGETGAVARPERPQRQVWIDPPLPPYAPALRQHGIGLNDLLIVRPGDRAQWLWASVQALRAGRELMVLCWPGQHRLRYADLRQLQVTAAEHGGLGFVLHDLARGRRGLQHSTPAPLRLRLAPGPAALEIDILKQRGSAAGQHILMPHPPALQPPRQRRRTRPAVRPATAQRPAPSLFPEVRV